MVFESVVTEVLNKILGDYVENLDHTQLKIGIWGGDVVLKNLKLRENALDDLDLPLQLIHGFLGKLVLKIPWKNLYGEPVVAQVEDFYLLISPKQSIEYNAEKEAKYDLQSKKAALQKLEEAKRLELEKDKPKPDQSFTEKLTAQIVNNLQLKIENVHLRYEDTTTTGKPFAFGVTLNQLELYTTDLNWIKCYMTEQASRVYKLANLDSLSVYMNCDAVLFTEKSTNVDEVSSLFRNNIARREIIPSRYNYIIGPISSMAKLQLNMNPEYDDPPFIIPKIDLSLDMEKLKIGITSTQFQDILKLSDSMNRLLLGQRYRKHRPFNKPYKGHYKEWWKFAITSVLEEDIRRRTRYWCWEYIKEHRELCNTYAVSIKEVQLSKKPPAALVETCNLCEQKLDLFNLILIRNRVQLEVDKVRQEEEKKASQKKGWFSWWGGSKANMEDSSNNIVKKFEAAMTDAEKEKLYKAIGYQENAERAAMPEGFEAIKMNFKLEALEIGVFDDIDRATDRRTILLMNFTLATCSVTQRPAGNAISVTAGVKEMKLTGLRNGDYLPTLIESQVPEESNLLSVFFETNPLDKKCDQRIRVRGRPLQIVYDGETIVELAKTFSPPKSVNLSEIEEAASEKMANFKERSATGMQYIVDKHQILEVDIRLMPNILIVPAKGKYIPGDVSLIVVSLGELSVTTELRESGISDVVNLYAAGHDRDSILRAMMAKAYDKFKIAIEDVQIMVSKPNENWQHVLNSGSLCEMHVLQHTSLIVTAELCVVSDDPRLPKAKVGILIPSVNIDLTEDRIFEALGIVTSIPLPESNEPEPTLKKSTSFLALSRQSVSKLMDLKVMTKKPTAEELSTEIIQYTNLEVTFALKQFGVILYKSKATSDQEKYDETPSDKFRTPIEEMAPDEFGESSTDLIEVAPHNDDKILSFQVLQVEGFMAQRTYELVATAKLGAINFTQYDNYENNKNVRSIIDTPRTDTELEYLLTISYTMVNKSTPEFSTKYHSTEQLIVINFSKLNLTLHQECLQKLMQIGQDLQNKLELLNKSLGPKDRVATTDTEGIISKLATIIEEAEDDGLKVKQEKARPKRKLVNSIKIKVKANLEQVAVLLTCRKRDLALLMVQNFFAGVVVKTSYTELTLRLKDFIVRDLNPVTVHPTVISIVGEDAFKCQIVMYNLEETAYYNSDNIKIDVKMGCLRIIFLNWFVTSVLNFLNNFQAAQEALVSASAAAADAAKQNAINAYEDATRLKLNIRISAPVIIVPVNSFSYDALCLDLGSLNLTNFTNEIDIVGNEHSPAIMDEIKLELKHVQLAKVQIIPPELREESVRLSLEKEDFTSFTSSSVDETSLYGVTGHVHMLDPISFTLVVKRNLSSSWYKDIPEVDVSGHLKSIKLNLHSEDYALVMDILNKNLPEGQGELQGPPPKVQKVEEAVVEVHNRASESRLPSRTPSAKKLQTAADKKSIYEQFKFNFQFDGVIVNIFQANREGLARFGLYFLSVKGKMLVDGTLSTSVVLCDIQIDDIRPNVNSKITKYLCRKEWKSRESDAGSSRGSEYSDSIRLEKNYMLDLTAMIKENDTFAEVRVCGFDLIITIDFLVTLAEFFKLPETESDDMELENTSAVRPGIDTKSAPRTPKKTVSTPVNQTPTPDKKLNLMLYIEEPDIILIESLEDVNTNAIIFNAQVRLNYRAIGSKEIISGQIDALKMYMCSFMPERREATKHFILHPCVISLQGSTPDQEGLHISLNLTDIILNISPATIELINKAMVTLSSRTEKVATRVKEVDYSSVWVVDKFTDKNFWFLVDQAYDALEVPDEPVELMVQKTEKCIVEVPSITLVVETGVGYYTTPMLFIEMKLNSTVSNWSQNMKIAGALNLYMNYYNHALGVWEPLIEQLEKPDQTGMIEYLPWELQFGLEIQTNKIEIDDGIEEPTTKITIESEEMLEITMSKTCLETLKVLGEAFSYAIDSKGLSKPEVIAPYVVENDTGFDISLNFTRGIFTLHECHMPNASSRTDVLNSSLVFQCLEADQNLSPEQVKDCTISPGGRAYLQTKDLSKITSSEDEAYNIYVVVGGIDKEVILPVSKSDQRYFPLYRDTNQDPWGIISHVTSEYGTTRINIHGVVNVKNHFTTNVNIYRNKQNSSEKILIGEVAPGEVFHVPLHAIYADSKELYFSLPSYNVSIQGIKWNDCPTDFNYHRHLQCDPVDTFEPLYINAIRLKTEVFHEHTMKFMLLSAYYTIHLRPPLYLRNALPIDIKVSVAGCTVHHLDGNNALELDEVDKIKSLVKEDLLDYGEKAVNPGDVLHLPTVQLTGRRKETKSYIVVRLIQYLEKDWSCTTEISEDHEEYATWTFCSYDSAAKIEMDLRVRFEDRYGSLMLTVYSPFWMMNKTGLMLSYKTNFETLNVLYHPPEYNGPILFSFRDKIFFDKKRVSIRVDNGEWSEKIPLDVAGANGEVKCDANEQSYHIGVHNHLTQNSLTKQITFIPYYIVTNKCNFSIELQEHSRPGDPWTQIPSNGCVPFWPRAEAKKVILKVSGQTTVPFNYSEVQCVLLKLESNQYGGINVDVQVTDGGVYITFTNYVAGDAPGLLINHSSQTITFHEKGNVNERHLEPLEKVLFTWTDPAGHRLLLLGREDIENDLRRDGVGQITLEGGKKAYWVSFLDGLQRVLLFTEMSSIAEKVVGSSDMQKVTQEIEVRIHGIGLSVLNNATGVDVLYLGIKSSGIIWEYKKSGKKRFKQFNIEDSLRMEEQYQAYVLSKQVKESRKFLLDQKYEIDFDNMTYTKSNTKRAILRTFYPGFWFDLKTSPFQTQLHAKINKIQIDNQLTDCIFPVVLAPIPPPKSIAATTALKPFVECSIVERVVPNSTVNQFKYCKLLIQEFHFKVDIVFLSAIAEMFTADLTDEQAAKLFNEDVDSIEKPLSALVEIHSAQEQKNFYDNLHLGPLKIHVSFSMAGSDTTALPGLLSTLVQGVGVTLTDVNDVVFKLAFFEREYGFFTHNQLQSEITAHYVGQALKQLYVLVLGLDVLGNPYGLVVGLKTGVQDLFYEPFQGAIQGPGEFAEGLVLGVKSLFGHTVGGAAGAVSKITGAMGKGLAVLTFDEDYQKKRRQALNRRPANFQEGIARSGKGLVMGVVDGVSGVFTKPISGAKEEGVEGFFKGLGKGAIGLVARPTAGVVDFASGSFEAVKRATESNEDTQRLRPPRFMHLDNVLRPYSLSEAKGNKLLKEIEKGKYASTDSFSHCEEVILKQEIVLVSNHRVIYATKNDLFGNWTIHWTYLWNEISSIFSSDRGVEIVLRKEGKKVFGLFASSETARKVISVPQRARREYLANLMESLRTGT